MITGAGCGTGCVTITLGWWLFAWLAASRFALRLAASFAFLFATSNRTTPVMAMAITAMRAIAPAESRGSRRPVSVRSVKTSLRWPGLFTTRCFCILCSLESMEFFLPDINLVMKLVAGSAVSIYFTRQLTAQVLHAQETPSSKQRVVDKQEN